MTPKQKKWRFNAEIPKQMWYFFSAFGILTKVAEMQTGLSDSKQTLI